MKDKIALPAPGVPESPSASDQRLPYVVPMLTVLGELVAITHAVGNSGRADGGLNFGFKSSGV